MTDEKSISEDDVREELLKEVNVPAHWGYMLFVLGGGFVVMIAFMAVLGGGG